MIRRAAALALVGALALGACAPTTSYQGFQAVEANPKDVKVGVDSKATVMERLGSPSAVAAFDPDTWYYISQVSNAVAFHYPQVKVRNIVAIVFDKGDDKVTTVKTYSLKDGHVIPYDKHESPTRGRELSAVEQILGTIGNTTMTPQQDTNPNSGRPQ